MERISFAFIILVIWSINSFLACSARNINNLTTDQDALLAFKAHVTNDPYNILANNWSTTTSICNWIGVSCGVLHQRVIALSLSNMSLRGTIAPHLGNLTFLSSLDVSFNSFGGFIPHQLAHLRRLKIIDFRYNEFKGEVPSWFGSLPALQQLRLRTNNFTGTIPTSLSNLSKLETLDLRVNLLHGYIPQEIGNLSNLRSLNLSYNQLTGSIPLVIFNISSLEELNLAYNSLYDTLPLDICDHLPKLKLLYLEGNQLHGPIPRNLYKCGKLEYLELGYNEFSGNIPREIGNLTLLKNLRFLFNNLTGTLPHEICNSFLNLEIFNVGHNSLTGIIPVKTFNISTMKILDLGFNQFTGYLPSSMGLWLPNLEELYLGTNYLSGIIPSSVGNASKLSIVSMDTNSFTGSIPNTFGDLRLLRQLFLGLNDLTKEYYTLELGFYTSLTNCRQLELLQLSYIKLNGTFPNSFGNLSTSLKYFQAIGSEIKGKIPIGIENLRGLVSIDLGENELTGSIPTTLGKLAHLQQVILRQNRLQGPIPDELCMLKNLGDLYLSDNEFNGPIPSCLADIKSLRFLYLDANKLTFTIPSILWSLKDLVHLNLSSNLLSGYLESDVGSMKVINEIDLSWNQLAGNVPTTIGGAQSLSYLSLAHNNFEGSIPQSMSDLIGLEFLDLSSNNLSGVIPTSLEKLRYLKNFNVSYNKLEGEIPNGGQFANFTAQSYMKNDELCGAPQLQVQPCKAKTHQRSITKVVRLLKYILPFITATTIAVSLIFVFTRRTKRKMKLLAHKDSLPLAWRRISYHELVQATNAFCESNLLGMGSVGSVYKGILSDGMTVAVKVFNLNLEGAIKSFDVECEVMRNIRHRNLVKIISSCTNLDFKALVLTYMPNGSLEKWLYSHNYSMDILTRLNVMIDVATALEYLHHGYATPIVHCDLKPSNILLDEDMIAHVGDFGIAKLLGGKEFIEQTKTLATIGYMAPEYGMDGIVSTSGDVYSYGIVLMETFTRKKPTDELFSSGMSLRSWVLEASYGSIMNNVDRNFIEMEDEYLSAKEQCLSSIFALALECSINSPTERITMEHAVARLMKIKSTFLENTGMNS